jgi:hypothetical protein
MKLLLVLLLAAGLASCGRCGAAPVSETAPVEVDGEELVTSEVPLPGTIYKAAYEKARQEIRPEEAEDRLWDLERDIELDDETPP